MKITFIGAGSTVFARNVIGDCMCSEVLRDSVFALYDIDGARLGESRTILEAMRAALGGYGRIECYLGLENREHFRKTYLKPLLESGRIKMTIPDKTTSKNQKYKSTPISANSIPS